MNKREKIIVWISILVAVYGLIDYFILSGSGSSDHDRQIASQKVQSGEFVKTASAALSSIAMAADDKRQLYLLTLAQTQWQKDVFVPFERKAASVNTTVEEAPVIELVYSGFIQAGSRFIAVINGMEYLAGEIIEEAGYKVSGISPARVVLLTQANKEIILSLEEN